MMIPVSHTKNLPVAVRDTCFSMVTHPRGVHAQSPTGLSPEPQELLGEGGVPRSQRLLQWGQAGLGFRSCQAAGACVKHDLVVSLSIAADVTAPKDLVLHTLSIINNGEGQYGMCSHRSASSSGVSPGSGSPPAKRPGHVSRMILLSHCR
jgi:hypothetical protein